MNYLILLSMAAYMALVIGIGIYFSNKNKTSDDYFIGGRGLGPWVTAMSAEAVSYKHIPANETGRKVVCRLLL